MLFRLVSSGRSQSDETIKDVLFIATADVTLFPPTQILFLSYTDMRFWQQPQSLCQNLTSSKYTYLEYWWKTSCIYQSEVLLLIWDVLCSKYNLLMPWKVALYLFSPASVSLCGASFPTRSLIITCVWQVKSILSTSGCLCLTVHLSVSAYPGIYSATDIRPQRWRVSSSSPLAQTPALMRLPSSGWTQSQQPRVPPHTGPAHRCLLFPVHK